METQISQHQTPNSKIKEVVRKLRGEAVLYEASHGTYFSLTVETCLNYGCQVYSTHLDGYDFNKVGQDEIMDEETMNEVAGMLKRSSKWVFEDRRA